MLVDDGPCPTERCGLGSRCSWRPDVQFYCVCSNDDCTSTAATSTDSSCTERVDCIVPVVILVVIGVLVIVLVVVVCCYRRRQKDHDKSLMMVFSRSDSTNPVLDLQTIETQSVTVSHHLLCACLV